MIAKQLPASITDNLKIDTRGGLPLAPFYAFGQVAGFGANMPKNCKLTPQLDHKCNIIEPRKSRSPS